MLFRSSICYCFPVMFRNSCSELKSVLPMEMIFNDDALSDLLTSYLLVYLLKYADVFTVVFIGMT